MFIDTNIETFMQKIVDWVRIVRIQIRPSRKTGSRSDPHEKPDPDPILKKNRIQIRPSWKTGFSSDPHKTTGFEPHKNPDQ